MKKDVSSHREVSELKAYRTRNRYTSSKLFWELYQIMKWDDLIKTSSTPPIPIHRYFVRREDCADVLDWIGRTQTIHQDLPIAWVWFRPHFYCVKESYFQKNFVGHSLYSCRIYTIFQLVWVKSSLVHWISMQQISSELCITLAVSVHLKSSLFNYQMPEIW